MAQYIIAFVFFTLALAGMLIVLKLGKYKEKDSGCCGGGNCSVEHHEKVHGKDYKCEKFKTNKSTVV